MTKQTNKSANKAPKTNNLRGTIDAMVRKAIRYAALMILAYLAWKGVADLVGSAHVARLFAAYASVTGLLALFFLV